MIKLSARRGITLAEDILPKAIVEVVFMNVMFRRRRQQKKDYEKQKSKLKA